MLLLFDQELQPHLKLINLSSSRVSMAGDSVAPSSIDSLFFSCLLLCLLAASSSRHLFFFCRKKYKDKRHTLNWSCSLSQQTNMGSSCDNIRLAIDAPNRHLSHQVQHTYQLSKFRYKDTCNNYIFLVRLEERRQAWRWALLHISHYFRTKRRAAAASGGGVCATAASQFAAQLLWWPRGWRKERRRLKPELWP